MKTKLLKKFRKIVRQSIYIESSLINSSMYTLWNEYMYMHSTYIVNNKKDLQELCYALKCKRRECIMSLIDQYKHNEWNRFCKREIRKSNKQNTQHCYG